MITNQVMKRPLANFTVEQRTKDGFFNATTLIKQWNSVENLHTQNSGYVKKAKDIDDYFNLSTTKEFIKALCEEENLDTPRMVYVKSKARADRGGGTWVHPLLFIDIAMWLNPHFKVKVLKFVSDQMLTYRNEAGDAYKQLSSAMSKISTPQQMKQYMPIIGRGINFVITGRHEHQLATSMGLKRNKKNTLSSKNKLQCLSKKDF